MNYTKIDLRTLKDFCRNIHGNIYFKHLSEREYQVVDGFTYNELDDMMRSGYEMIFVSGPPLNPFELKED